MSQPVASAPKSRSDKIYNKKKQAFSLYIPLTKDLLRYLRIFCFFTFWVAIYFLLMKWSKVVSIVTMQYNKQKLQKYFIICPYNIFQQSNICDTFPLKTLCHMFFFLFQNNQETQN